MDIFISFFLGTLGVVGALTLVMIVAALLAGGCPNGKETRGFGSHPIDLDDPRK